MAIVIAAMDHASLYSHPLLVLSHVDSGLGNVTCFGNTALTNMTLAEV